MFTHSGRIVAVDDRHVRVCVTPRPGCARCEAGQGCGGGLFGRLVSRGESELTVRRPSGRVAPGDAVRIGVPARSLVRASIVVYGLPLVGLLVGSAAGGWLAGADAGAIAGGVVGLVSGILAGRAAAGGKDGLGLRVLSPESPR